MLRLSPSRRSATWAALSLFALVTAGCGGSSSSRSSCGTHHYAYLGGAAAAIAGAPWSSGAYGDGYGGGYGGAWYDPGDDGSDYYNSSSDDGSGSSGGGSGDDGQYYDDGSGSGDDGSGSSGDGSGDDGSGSSGDGTGDDGSGSDGSGDDGSGDDGSGDDGTAAKKHLHTTSAALHTQSSQAANGCYAYTCTLVCVVGNPASQQREAQGQSAISTNDACTTAAHGLETWAHHALGADVSACERVNDDGSIPASTPVAGSRTPAAPAVGTATATSQRSAG